LLQYRTNTSGKLGGDLLGRFRYAKEIVTFFDDLIGLQRQAFEIVGASLIAHLHQSKDRLVDGVLEVEHGGEAAIEPPGIAAADAQHLGERVFDRHVEGIVATLV
jgi:hypothetical protein